jgi:hypothetical protein
MVFSLKNHDIDKMIKVLRMGLGETLLTRRVSPVFAA